MEDDVFLPTMWQGVDYKKTRRNNTYLNKQYNRIFKHINKGNLNRAVDIWARMFQRSDSYLLYTIKKTLIGLYFKYDLVHLNQIVWRFSEAVRKLDMYAVYRKVYTQNQMGRFAPRCSRSLMTNGTGQD